MVFQQHKCCKICVDFNGECFLFVDFSLEHVEKKTFLVGPFFGPPVFEVGSKDPELALCFAGAGIYQLQSELQKRALASHTFLGFGRRPFIPCHVRGQRDSHSVLGSIFLNPSVAAGVSYGSGGTQIRKETAEFVAKLFV